MSSGRGGSRESIDRRRESCASLHSVQRILQEERGREREKVEANTDRYTAACEAVNRLPCWTRRVSSVDLSQSQGCARRSSSSVRDEEKAKRKKPRDSSR